MKRYTVIFHPEAEKDIRVSLEWGVRMWGKRQAQQWVRRLYGAIKKRLGQFPESCPLAPEGEDVGVSIRQFVIDRYRVLFTVHGNTVIVLYVRGGYVGPVVDEPGDEA